MCVSDGGRLNKGMGWRDKMSANERKTSSSDNRVFLTWKNPASPNDFALLSPL